ncbi:hypothetical protein Tco_0108849 [Tanacetum coccineum]
MGVLQLKHSMLANRSMRKTIAELNDMLKLTKKGLPKKDNAHVVLTIRGGTSMKLPMLMMSSVVFDIKSSLHHKSSL